MNGLFASDTNITTNEQGQRKKKKKKQQRTGALGLGVAAIAEKVNVRRGNARGLGSIEKRMEVGLVAVHPTVRDEPKQMKAPIAGLGPVKGRDERRVLTDRARRDGQVNADNVLKHNAAGANVEVAHLTVAHQPIRQADVKAMRGKRHPLRLALKARHHGRLSPNDR